jgi:hypothetical protein
VDGMQTIRDIAKVPTDMYEKPRIPVHIVNCGEVDSQDSLSKNANMQEDDDLTIVERFEQKKREKAQELRKRDGKFIEKEEVKQEGGL